MYKCRYYKESKISRFLVSVLWVCLGANIGLFLMNVYQGDWFALLGWATGSFIGYMLHDHYTKWLPKMDELSKSIHELQLKMAEIERSLHIDN